MRVGSGRVGCPPEPPLNIVAIVAAGGLGNDGRTGTRANKTNDKLENHACQWLVLVILAQAKK